MAPNLQNDPVFGGVLGTIAPNVGQAGSSVIPSGPVQDIDTQLKQASLQQSQLGMQSYAAAQARAQQLASQIAGLQQQQSQAAANAPRPWTPSYEPVTGGKSLGRDVGRGLLQGLSLTAPGNAIESRLFQRQEVPYEQGQKVRAQQIADLQAQMGLAEKPMESAATLAYRAPMGVAQLGRSEAAMLSAQSRAAYDQAMIPIRQKQQEIQQAYNQGKLKEEEYRTQIDQLIGQGHDAAMRSVAGTYADQRDRDVQVGAAEKEWQTETGTWYQIKQAMGMAPTPPSQQPAAPPGPTARGTKASANSGKGRQMTPAGGPDPNAHPGYVLKNGPKGYGYYKQ